ncbi:MAG: hypothetical protein ACR2GY_04815 [Phycisphaerales bacterium]
MPQRKIVRVDTGAARLGHVMAVALGFDTPSMVGGTTRHHSEIVLHPLRNQSRARSVEVDSLRQRLLTLLKPAGEEVGLRFVEQATGATEYTLSGTVYVIQNREGESFELYLDLRPIGANWSIWRNGDPVKLQRRPDDLDTISFDPQR